MNMIKSMQRGLAAVGLSLVCLMAVTMNVEAATDGTETELVSSFVTDASDGESSELTADSDAVPSGPSSDNSINNSADVSADVSADDSALEACTVSECDNSDTATEIYAGRFTTTAYCNCRKCCRGGTNRTKSGTIPQAGHTISADLNVFPLGTKLRIGGVVYTVEDSGSSIKGNKLDIYFNSHSQALQYGRQSADVYIVQ